jgi:cell division protein FtsW
LYAAGVNRRTLLVAMAIFTFIGMVLALDQTYRRERFLAFMHPMANATGAGYQLAQSLIALGSGHLTGSGIGGSVAKWNLLPNAWTDFIFAIIGNELGLLGGIAVIVAFAAFAYFGLRIARRTPDRFSSLLAVGITAWVVSQAFINIGGVEGALPETGVPLPFISSGGSSLVVALVAVGLLYNIASAPTRGALASAKSRHVDARSVASRPAARRVVPQKSATAMRAREAASRRTHPSAPRRAAGAVVGHGRDKVASARPRAR